MFVYKGGILIIDNTSSNYVGKLFDFNTFIRLCNKKKLSQNKFSANVSNFCATCNLLNKVLTLVYNAKNFLSLPLFLASM